MRTLSEVVNACKTAFRGEGQRRWRAICNMSGATKMSNEIGVPHETMGGCQR
jgi:hypothetical protein